VLCFSSSNPGVLNTWFEEKSAATPTAAITRQAKAQRISAGGNQGQHMQKFVVHDPLDLEYSALATSKIVGYFNLYTDNAVYGASVVATDYVEISLEMLIQFRGFA
jgi:hypothetical protein